MDGMDNNSRPTLIKVTTFNADIGGVFTAVDNTISNDNVVEAHFNYL